jgi:peroxiredoxin
MFIDKRTIPIIIKAIVFICILLPNCYSAVAIEAPTGKAAPDFTLTSVDGNVISLSDYKGSITVILYLRAEQTRSLMNMDEAQDIYTRYKDKGIQVIGIIAKTENRETILKVMAERKIDFPVLIDSQRNVYGDYGIRVYPSTVIIDSDGRFAYGIPGHALSYKSRVEGDIRLMLGEITEKELTEILSPRTAIKDKATLAAERRYNLALRFVEARLIEQAIDTAILSIEANSNNAISHILLGFLFLDTQEVEKAFEEFNTALQIAPDSHDAMTGLGATLILRGEIDSAIEILTEATLSNPNPQMTFYELGKAYELKGEKDKSIKMFKKVMGKIVKKSIIPSSISICE